MASIPVSAAEVFARHPAEAQRLVEKVRKGKTKKAQTDPATWKWTYRTMVRVDGAPSPIASGADLVKWHAQCQKREAKMSVEELVKDELSRTTTTHQASSNGYNGIEVQNPPVVEAWIRNKFEDERAEQARFESLSPEEKAKEFQDLLKECDKFPGFVALKV
jgi:hypothetical protein